MRIELSEENVDLFLDWYVHMVDFQQKAQKDISDTQALMLKNLQLFFNLKLLAEIQ